MTQEAVIARTQTKSVGVDNIKEVRQKLLDKMDALPQSKWGRGFRLTGGLSGLTALISRSEKVLWVEFRGQVVMKVTLNPDKSQRFQTKSGNRHVVEEALIGLQKSYPEVFATIADW